MGFLQDFIKPFTTPTWRPDEDKFCWKCMKRRPHKWIDEGGIFSVPKWRCKECGHLRRASLWDICK